MFPLRNSTKDMTVFLVVSEPGSLYRSKQMLLHERLPKISVSCILRMHRSWRTNRKIGGNSYSESAGGRSARASFTLKTCYMFGHVRKKPTITVRKDTVSVKRTLLMESRLIKGLRTTIYQRSTLLK